MVKHVTIVVLNYNYARFLDQAIDSALNQNYPSFEVVVVDNGSTDNSLDVIAQYGDRVRLVRQDVNIGQGQGYNLGFEAARGEWLIWLDADDLLDAPCLSVCMSLVSPDTAKVQFPLRLVDGQAQALGGEIPFIRHEGDVQPLIRRFGHYAGPPGSGNLYRRSAVAPYFPVPVADWPICTDTVPFITAPFHGLVADSGVALGSYRLHGKSAPQAPGYTGNFSVSMASEVSLNTRSRDLALKLLRDRSRIDVPGPFLTLPTHVRHRVISWRTDPDQHPFAQDTAWSLWLLMHRSLAACPGYTWAHRFALRLWAAGALFMPKTTAMKLMSATRATLSWDQLWRWARGPTI